MASRMGWTAARAAGRRFMSSAAHADHHTETMLYWKKISYGAVVTSVVGTAVIFIVSDHSHPHGPDYPYMKIRSKPYPWGASDCNMFDLPCKREWKKAQAALK